MRNFVLLSACALAACDSQASYDHTYSKAEPQLSVTSDKVTLKLASEESAKALRDMKAGNFKVLAAECDRGYSGPVVPHGGTFNRSGYCNYSIYNEVGGWKLTVMTSSRPPANPRAAKPTFTLNLPIYRETDYGNAQLALLDDLTCSQINGCTDLVPTFSSDILPFISSQLNSIN